MDKTTNNKTGPAIMRPGFRRLMEMRYRRLKPWIQSPDRLNEVLPGRLGAFLSAVGWLFCRESTLLIFGFTFAFLLSIFPLIVLMITITGLPGLEGLQQTLYLALEHFFPVSQEWIVRNLQIYIGQVGTYQVISIILLAWAGSALFFSLEASLDSAYRVKVPRNFVGSQILGTILVIAVGTLALGAVTTLHGLVWLARDVLALDIPRLQLFTLTYYVLAFSVVICLMACAFHWLPNRNVPFRRILPEAIFATSLVIVADLVFRWIAPEMGLEEVYGPFFVSITILLWGYTFGCIIVGSARLAANGFFIRDPEAGTDEEALSEQVSSTGAGTAQADP